MRFAWALCLLATSAAVHSKPAPVEAPCPSGLPVLTRCLSEQDNAGAFHWLALAAQWNQVLVMQAHGGPELGAPKAKRRPTT